MTHEDGASEPPPVGLEPLAGASASRRQVLAWALWDWGSAAFNAVITTFVFTVYLTGSLFVDPALRVARDAETVKAGPAHAALAAAQAPLSAGLGYGLALAGIVVALIAPVLGQRSDASGHRKRWLGVNSAVVVIITAALFFVRGEPSFFLFGVVLVSLGTVFYEVATVSYNAMLVQVSTPTTIGKVSGLGWGAGYLGGILSSALFRDGLVGVFTFGGILAQGTFGFSSGQVIIFAIAANVVAGVSTVISGLFDDRFGPKPVIVTSLVGLIIAGTAVFFAHDGGQGAFWTGGLVLCLFVGPAQSSSRSFLARITPAGREGQVFGLYATTGRAVSFLAPLLFATLVTVFGAQYWGILGIVGVLLVGLLLLLPVRVAR